MSDDQKERDERNANGTPEPAEQADSPQAGEGGDAAAAPQGAAEGDADREAKLQAAAEARAARAAARAAQAGEGGDAAAAPQGAADGDADKEAKRKAAEEARAARAAARAKAAEGEGGEPPAPKEPSPKQPLLDRAVSILRGHVSDDAVVEAFINEADSHLPVIVIRSDKWLACAEVFKNHDEFRLNYLRNVSGSDMETHLEVAYHMLSLHTKNEYCVKVKTDRETPSIPSVTPVWATANWNEREIYDLVGIDFPGHPDLRRIMMPDDWVGYPLRKDYEPIDPEV